MFICDISQPNGKVNRFHLGKGIFQIGKGASCRIVVEDPLVSRTHAELRIDETSVTIMDLNSTNGTWINQNSIVKPYGLQVGDEIVIGTSTRMTVKEIPTKLDSMFFSIGGSGAGAEYFSEESIFDDVDLLAVTQGRSSDGANRDRGDGQEADHGGGLAEMDLEDIDFSDMDDEPGGARRSGTPSTVRERKAPRSGSEDVHSQSSQQSYDAPSSVYKDDYSPFSSDAPFLQSSIYEDDFSPFASSPTGAESVDSGATNRKRSATSTDTLRATEQSRNFDQPVNRDVGEATVAAKVVPAKVPEMVASQEVLTTLVNLLDQPRVRWVLVSGSEGVRLVERGGAMHAVRVFSRHVSAESVLKGLGLTTSLRKPLSHEIEAGASLSAIPVGAEDWSVVIKRDIPRSRLSSFDSMVSRGMMSIELADFFSQCVQVKSNLLISSSSLSLGLELLEAAKKKAGENTIIAAFENETKTQGVQVGASDGYVFNQNLISDRDSAKTVLGHLNHLGINLISVDDLLKVDVVGILNFASGLKAGCIGCLESASPALGLARLAHSQGMDNLGVLSMMLISSCDLWVHLDANAEGNGYVEAVYDLCLGQDGVLHFAPIFTASMVKSELTWVASGRVPGVVDKFAASGVHWTPDWFAENEGT